MGAWRMNEMKAVTDQWTPVIRYMQHKYELIPNEEADPGDVPVEMVV